MALRIDNQYTNKTYRFNIQTDENGLGAKIYINGQYSGKKATTNSFITVTTDELSLGPVTVSLLKDNFYFSESYLIELGDSIFDETTSSYYFNYVLIKESSAGSIIQPNTNTLTFFTFSDIGVVSNCKRYSITATKVDYETENNRSFSAVKYVYVSCDGDIVRGVIDAEGVTDFVEAQENTVEILFGEALIEDLGYVDSDQPDDGNDGNDGNDDSGTSTESTITINLFGDLNSARVDTPNEFFSGELNKEQIEFLISYGTILTVKSSDIDSYRVYKLEVFDGVNTEEVVAEELQSLVGNINTDVDLTISVYTERVIKSIRPVIELKNQNTSREYNINTKANIPIGFNQITKVDGIKVYVSDQLLTFQIDDTVNAIELPSQFFNRYIGVYKVILVPFNEFGDGEPIEIIYNVVDEVYVGEPDIFNITYPQLVKGADYKGIDVEFEINWESVNTNYVKIYKDKTDYHIDAPAAGKLTLNFKDWLGKGGVEDIEDDIGINLTLLMIPYNSTGFDVVEGKTEVLYLKLDKSNLTIPRQTAINRIAEGFISQFDSTIFEAENSKYLTHLLHFGDGDNKLISNWVGSEDSLIVKLYEPLPTNVQPNQEIWISKPQSQTIIETVNITVDDVGYCQPLKGPNFSIERDNGIGFSFFEQLTASGSYTSNDLSNRYLETLGIDTTVLDIQYVNDSSYVFDNFVHFGSAEERVRNFYYKMQLVEQYKTNYENLVEATYGGGPLLTSEGYKMKTEDDIFEINFEINVLRGFDEKREAQRNLTLLNETIRNFDGFERFLYTSTDSLAYPKVETTLSNGLPIYEIEPTTLPSVLAWYENLLSLAANYDKYNPHYLVNNIPEFIKEDYQNDDFMLFLDMIGQHFDIIWAYINSLNRFKNIDERKEVGIPNDFVWYMLKAMGWDGKRAYNSQFLWEYVFGTNEEGFQKYRIPLKQANNEVWRRILNNLPYLLKHKGTRRAMKAVMACYGVPSSLLTIMEYGGPTNVLGNKTIDFTFDDITSALYLTGSSYVRIPWKQLDSTGKYPQSVEFRIKPDEVTDSTILTTSEFRLDIAKLTGSFVELQFNLGDGSTSPYMETPFLSGSPQVSTTYFAPVLVDASTEYVLGPEIYTSSLKFPLSPDYYSNVLLNKYSNGSSTLYEILLKTSDGNRIITSVSMSLVSDESLWESGTEINIGTGFNGNIDEIRLWKVPLQPSKFENHTLFPDAINGNSYTASTSDLLFRLDFERPQDLTSNPYIKNVSINDEYGVDFATSSLIYSASTYPYQYTPYERTVTAKVPSMGFVSSNKFRFEEQTLISDLSYKNRATKKAFDKSPIDSNKLGIFLSPTKELNLDILKAFGEFNIDNYIGNPSDEYKYEYSELKNLREYYFERLDRNINEYIQLVRYIDKSLFDVLADLAPVRANVVKGLLIEPHYLERSKTKWSKPTSEKPDYDAIIDTLENEKIEFIYDVINTEINIEDLTKFDVNYSDISASFDETDLVDISVDTPDYNAQINVTDSVLLEGSNPQYTASFIYEDIETVLTKVESQRLKTIGLENNSIFNLGFGLYGNSGTFLKNEYEFSLPFTSSRANAYLLKREFTEKILTQTDGWPRNSNNVFPVYEYVSVTKTENKISVLPFPKNINVTNPITSVTPLSGYAPYHYRYTNGLTTGMENSFFKGSKQTETTTNDGLPAVETFTVNPNILKVSAQGRGSGEPILIVE